MDLYMLFTLWFSVDITSNLRDSLCSCCCILIIISLMCLEDIFSICFDCFIYSN